MFVWGIGWKFLLFYEVVFVGVVDWGVVVGIDFESVLFLCGFLYFLFLWVFFWGFIYNCGFFVYKIEFF